MSFDVLFQEALAQPNKEVAERWLAAQVPAGATTGSDSYAATLRISLAYWAGYYTWAERERIFELFGAAHPIFGHRQVTSEEAFELGKQWALKGRACAS